MNKNYLPHIITFTGLIGHISIVCSSLSRPLQIIGLNILDRPSGAHLVLHPDERFVSYAEIAIYNIHNLFEFLQFLFDEDDACDEGPTLDQLLNKDILGLFEEGGKFLNFMGDLNYKSTLNRI